MPRSGVRQASGWRYIRRREHDRGAAAIPGPSSCWHTVAVRDVPAVVMARDGASLRLAEPAQHTGELDWDGARACRP